MSKTALVTGGAKGIGLGSIRALARQGWNVAFTGRDEDALRAAEQEMRQAGVQAVGISHSVTDEAGWAAVIEVVLDRFGSLDALVCNAGISPKRNGLPVPFLEADDAIWQETFATNLYGVIYGMRAALPVMVKAGAGSIVIVSSIAGMTTINDVSAHYAASKAAVLGLMRQTASTFGPVGVRINAVAPGRTLTDSLKALNDVNREAAHAAIALRRDGLPEEVGEAIAFLCGTGSAYITGECLQVTGGWKMFYNIKRSAHAAALAAGTTNLTL
jgi:3-oxoacyl-[acyl-carrier protein] reductase